MFVVAEEAVVVSVVVVVATTAVLVVTGTAELTAGILEDAITEMQQQTSSIQSTAAARESSKNLTTHDESQKQSDDYKAQRERGTDRQTDRQEASACRLLTSINAEQSPEADADLLSPTAKGGDYDAMLGYRAGTHALREEAQTTVLELIVVVLLLAWFLLALSVCSSRFTNPTIFFINGEWSIFETAKKNFF
jgi:hypothetical protein